MESKNNEFQGFHDEDLDPLVFVETEDNPELRAEALAIPRPIRDDSYIGPKKSRAELLLEQEQQEDLREWVPAEDTPNRKKMQSSILQSTYENLGKVIFFIIPIGTILVFLYYASTQL